MGLKGNVHSIISHGGTAKDLRYSSTLSLTPALNVGGWSTPRSGRFTPGRRSRYSFYSLQGGLRSRPGRVLKTSSTSVFEPRTLQPVVSHDTDYAIPAARIVVR